MLIYCLRCGRERDVASSSGLHFIPEPCRCGWQGWEFADELVDVPAGPSEDDGAGRVAAVLSDVAPDVREAVIQGLRLVVLDPRSRREGFVAGAVLDELDGPSSRRPTPDAVDIRDDAGELELDVAALWTVLAFAFSVWVYVAVLCAEVLRM